MKISISYSKNAVKQTAGSQVFFSNEKYNIVNLKKNLSSLEFNYVNELLKTSDKSKKLLVFEINSKKKNYFNFSKV